MKKVYIANRVMKLQDGSVCKPGDVWVPPRDAGHTIIDLMLSQGHLKEAIYIQDRKSAAAAVSADAKVSKAKKQPQQPSV